MKKRLFLVATLAAFSAWSSASAQVLVSGAANEPAGLTVFTPQGNAFAFSSLSFPDFTVTSSDGQGYVYAGNWGFASNGNWDGLPMIGQLSTTGLMRFTFGTGQSYVGAFLNYAPGNGPFTMSAFGQSGNLLASFDVEALSPISTPGGNNAGDVRGIFSAAGDIYALEMSGGHPGISELEYGATAAPEPASLVLMATGLLGLGVVVRRRRA